MSLLTNLVSYWKFDEAGASSNALDLVASNNLTEVNSPASVAGLINTARECLAASAQKFSDPSGLIHAYGDWSRSLWFQVPAGSTIRTSGRILDWSDGTQNNYLYATVKSADSFCANCIQLSILDKLNGQTQPGDGNEWICGTPILLTAGSWHHLVLVGQSNRFTIYLDGACVSGAAGFNAQGSHLASYTSAYLAGLSIFGDAANDLIFDESGFWSRALSAQEVQALFNAGAALPESLFASATIPAAPIANVWGRLQYQMSSFLSSNGSLIMAESSDGVYWTPYAATLSGAPHYPGAFADPSICYWDGSFWMAWTYFNDFTKLQIAKSNDLTLTSWTWVQGIDTSGTAAYAAAPEWVKNDDGTTYTDPTDGRPRLTFNAGVAGLISDNDIYVTYPTDNAMAGAFAAPVKFSGTAYTHGIDSFVLAVGHGASFELYYDTGGTINKLVSTTGLSSGYDSSEMVTFGGTEGPCTIKIGALWYCYISRDSTLTGTGYVSSPDRVTWSGQAGVSNTLIANHGTIMQFPSYPITGHVVAAASAWTPGAVAGQMF